jgi:hypothetical protein
MFRAGIKPLIRTHRPHGGVITAAQLIPHRHFQKIVVTNPTGVRLLRYSKTLLTALLLFYGSALAIGGGLYAASSYYLKDKQPIAGDFSLLSKIQTRLAVYYQDLQEDEEIAEDALIKALQTISREEGIADADDGNGDNEKDPRKFTLLNLDQLNSHSKEWQGTYIDLVIRLALVKADLGDADNAKKLNRYSINLPMDLGSKDLRSESLRLAARISSLEGDFSTAEKYLLDCIKFNEFYQSDILFLEQGSLLLDPSSDVNNETFNALLDIGVVYTRLEQYSKALEIFLNLLQISKEAKSKEDARLHLKKSDIPLLKNYVGEILYKKGLLNKSIEWCNDSFKEAFKFSRSDVKSAFVTKQSLKNLIGLYGKTNDEELKKQAIEQYEEVDVNFLKPKKFDILSVIF